MKNDLFTIHNKHFEKATLATFNVVYGLSLYITLLRNKKIKKQSLKAWQALERLGKLDFAFNYDEETKQLAIDKGSDITKDVIQISKNWKLQDFWQISEDFFINCF